MEELKKYTNAKIVPTVHTKKNVAKELRAIEQLV